MTPAARAVAAIEILERWQEGGPGIDRILAAWGRGHRFAGSGDRRAIADLVYDALRRWRSAAWVAGSGEGPRGAVIGALRLAGMDPAALFAGDPRAPAPLSAEEEAGRPLEAAPEALRLDLPDWLMPHLTGVPRGALAGLRERAPVDLRANLLKTTRGEAIARLRAEGIAALPGPLSPTAIRLDGPVRRLEETAAFREGLVELQDAASQAAADHAAARPGETVLDFCAGGGGKTLALAAAMGGEGPLLAHDADAARLAQLAPRAARAGAGVRCLEPGGWQALGPIADLVFVDAPCTGSGAWRRNPDAKWRLDPARLEALTALQDRVLDEAARAVRPRGRLVYATCSLLGIENGARIACFLAAHPGWSAEIPPLALTPLDGADGFFAQTLRAPPAGPGADFRSLPLRHLN